jgi:hypothetical protein
MSKIVEVIHHGVTTPTTKHMAMLPGIMSSCILQVSNKRKLTSQENGSHIVEVTATSKVLTNTSSDLKTMSTKFSEMATKGTEINSR